MSVVVVRVPASDWRVVRDIRLQALLDAPAAFASSHAREVGETDEAWQRRVESGAWFVARESDETVGAPVGLVAGIADRETGGPHLVSMWVDPQARGRGVGLALVDAVKAWATGEFTSDDGPAERLILWVADGNLGARRLYQRCGFVDTGRRQPLPSDPTVGESLMSCPLAP